MKKIYYFIIALLLFCISSLQAQTTQGKEFWLTFGRHCNHLPSSPYLDLQIRIANNNLPSTVTIYFTNLNDSVQLNLSAYEVYTHSLNNIQKEAVYNTLTGITNYSIHITSSEPVSVFGFLGFAGNGTCDATNVLPVTALGTSYYQISYDCSFTFLSFMDAYGVVATQNNTNLYHNGELLTPVPLNAGEVYYRTSTDMTGSYITSNNLVAFFALHQGTQVPNGLNQPSVLFQQLAPVKTWDKTFFVPVTVMESEIVRIVASQNSTNITQITGGTIRYGVPGAKTTLNDLMAGDFVELDIGASGCYIKANQPVGVCAYLKFNTPPYPNEKTSSSQTWVPGIKQTVSNALVSPFVYADPTLLLQTIHYVLIITPTATRDNTKVSIGGMLPDDVSGGTWIENTDADMSFYSMPITNDTLTYNLSNPYGMIIFGYQTSWNGQVRSYYYPAYSAMRDLDAAFYANDVHFQDLEDNPFCENEEVVFQAEINGLHSAQESIKWYIGGVLQPALTDYLTWSQTFPIGEYEITMWVRFDNDSIISKTGTLKIMNCNMSAEFYVNNVHHANLQDTVFCNKEVHFQSEVENYTEITWYIDGKEYEPANSLDWYKSFETGEYEIKMVAFLSNGEPVTLVATLRMEVFWIKMRNVRY